MYSTIIFDLGGVLIDWNPRHLYRKIFEDAAQMEYFLEHIATGDWNEEQDGGRPLAEATDWLVAQHPDWEPYIRAFYGRWTVDLLEELHTAKQKRLYALTNWSAETWPHAWDRYPFLQYFEGILVSGAENMRKPDPRIYQLICERYDIVPQETVFIDDNLRNVKAAAAEGLIGIHFQTTDQVREELKYLGML